MAFDKIIVVDDELIIRKTLEQQLRNKRYVVASASTIAECEAYLAKDQFDLVFLDVRLPDGDGTELLERIAEDPEKPLVVMMTGYGSVESAVKCMRLGAFDYVIKPFSSDQIEVILKKAESYSQLVKVSRYFNSEATSKSEIIGECQKIQQLKSVIRKVAATEATVLITGENGTGKEMVANEIHRLSSLSSSPFIRVNCAAISENLIESEFFGHEKGSFTGATQRREGRFELANNGTILLDEISEISPQLQAKLLRVLQEKEFERVGGNKTIQVNVRVLATTNRDLIKAVKEGKFRQDLFYRLNVFPIEVPPLRERKEDIMLLAEKFLQSFSRKHGHRVKGYSKSAEEALVGHDWPGNVRELQNTVERAVILSDNNSYITPSNLGLIRMTEPLQSSSTDCELKNSENRINYGSTDPEVKEQTGSEIITLDELERKHILEVLSFTHGNRTHAAELLNISIRTLRNKINQYRIDGVDVPDPNVK
jgi:DNA-binding NtrC family response regulator